VLITCYFAMKKVLMTGFAFFLIPRDGPGVSREGGKNGLYRMREERDMIVRTTEGGQMANEVMPENAKTPGVPERREAILRLLAECFARDVFDVEEYERRVEAAEAAAAREELELLVRDVPADVKALVAGAAPGSAALRLNVSNGTLKADDARLAAGRVDLRADSSTVRLDYRRVRGLPAEIVICAELKYAALKIVVPPLVAVIDEMENSGSTFRYIRAPRHDGTPARTVLRLTGRAVWSSVKIKTR
jgi:hypothetical protein